MLKKSKQTLNAALPCKYILKAARCGLWTPSATVTLPIVTVSETAKRKKERRKERKKGGKEGGKAGRNKKQKQKQKRRKNGREKESGN